MDKFLDNVLGDRGCSADGSTTNNPVVQLMDRMFDSQLGSGMLGADAQQMTGGAGGAAYFANEQSTQLADQAYNQAMQEAMIQQGQGQAIQGQEMSMGMGMDMMHNGGGMMMMQQQMMMQRQAQHMAMQVLCHSSHGDV